MQQLIYRSRNNYNTDQNYNVWLTDAATEDFNAQGNDNLVIANYNRLARPYIPLNTFHGQAVNGTWQFTLCDEIPTSDNGLYHQALLSFTPAGYGDTAGPWRYPVTVNSGLDNSWLMIPLGIN